MKELGRKFFVPHASFNPEHDKLVYSSIINVQSKHFSRFVFGLGKGVNGTPFTSSLLLAYRWSELHVPYAHAFVVFLGDYHSLWFSFSRIFQVNSHFKVTRSVQSNAVLW